MRPLSSLSTKTKPKATHPTWGRARICNCIYGARYFSTLSENRETTVEHRASGEVGWTANQQRPVARGRGANLQKLRLDIQEDRKGALDFWTPLSVTLSQMPTLQP